MTQVESKKRDSMKSNKKRVQEEYYGTTKKKKKKKKKKNPNLVHLELGESKMYSPWRSKMTAK